MSIDALYTEIIMHHNKSTHNKRVLENATCAERGHNPNCGDDITLFVKVVDGIIEDASFAGSGCAISQASVSIMIDQVVGLSVEAAQLRVQQFLGLIKGETLSDDEMESLGDAAIFEGLSKMPARVKCGTLGWHCLQVVLNKS